MKKLYEKTWLAIFLVLIIYLLCVLLSNATIDVLKIHSSLMEIIILLLCLILMVGLFKYVLKVPNGKIPLLDFLRSIRLTQANNWKEVVVYAFGFTIIFSFFQISGSLIFHFLFHEQYFLILNNQTLLSPDTIFVSFFEEIVWRGIVLSILLKKYSENKAIAISALLFGSFHLLNILNPIHSVIWTISQSVWAIGFGYLYGILVVRTNSLIPSLVIHYLVNAFAGVWSSGLDKIDAASVIYGISFFGWVPVIVCLLILDYKYSVKINGPTDLNLRPL